LLFSKVNHFVAKDKQIGRCTEFVLRCHKDAQNAQSYFVLLWLGELQPEGLLERLTKPGQHNPYVTGRISSWYIGFGGKIYRFSVYLR